MVGDTFTLQTVGRNQGQQWVNTFAYQVSSVVTPGDEIPLLNSLFQEKFEATYEGAMVTTCQVDTIQIRKVLPAPAGPGYVFDCGWSGNRVGVGLPSEVAAVVKRATDTAGSKGRGRIYVPGALHTDFDQASGRWITEYKDLLEALATDMRAPLDSEFNMTFIPVLWSQLTLIARPITRSSVNDAPRAQRRRQPGRGI